MHGEHTFDFVLNSARQWADTNPNVRITPMQGGHCFMQEQPEAAAAAIVRFLLEPPA
jgi:pimeloyl-ACP methyl ester carboxylesterase